MTGVLAFRKLCFVTFCATGLVLSACHGDSDDPPMPAPTPSISTSPASVAIAANVNSSGLPTANVTVTFVNGPSTLYFSTTDFTSNGIASIDNVVYDARQATFRVNFKAPSGLMPATYNDTVHLLMCSDPQCRLVVATNPLAVNYTVAPPSGGNAPQVTLSSTSLTHSALFVESAQVAVTPDPNLFTFSNFASPPYVRVTAPTTGGVDALSFVMSDATHGGIALTLRAPSALTQATHDTVVNVTTCLDLNCVNPVANGAFTVALHYVVTDTVTIAGPLGYTMKVVPAHVKSLAANAQQSRIYAAVDPTASGNATAVVAVDPVTGTQQSAVLAAGRTPAALALSDDGQYLYVAERQSVVDRIITSSLSVDLSIPSGSANGIAVTPGLPLTFAVSGFEFLSVFDGAVPRANSALVATESVRALQWGAAPSVLYGTDHFVGGSSTVCRFDIDMNGMTSTKSCSPRNNGSYQFGNGRIYEAGGNVVDPTNWAIVATFSVPNATLLQVLPDAALGKAFAVVNTVGGGCSLQSFDLNSYAPLASLSFPTPSGSTCDFSTDIVRWGPRGIALNSRGSTSGYLIAISGGFVGP